MSDATHEFAHLAALALRDVCDPDATVHAADEALAALEQHVGALGREHRHAGRLVADGLAAMHADSKRIAVSNTEQVLSWLRGALRWARGGWSAGDLLCAGKDVERASGVVDHMPCEQRELKQLLRCVIGAVEREAIEMVVVQTQGSDRHAA